ncbi:MAG: peptidylprolyl isomerase [Verrucomicrobiota bacterium]
MKNKETTLTGALVAISLLCMSCVEKEAPAEAGDITDQSKQDRTEAGAQGSQSGPDSAIAESAMPELEGSEAGTNVIVSVEDNDLTAEQLARIVNQRIQSSQMAELQPEQRQAYAEQLKRNVIESFVDRNVLLETAKEKDIVVEKGEIDEVIEQVKGTVPEDMTFEQALNRMGMTMDELEEQIKGELKVQKLVEEKLETLPEIDEEQARAFYQEREQEFTRGESAEVRHILIKVDEGADETTLKEKKAEAEQLRDKLEEGADFAELAKEHSECGSAASGGNLGVIEKGRTVPAFEKAAFSQEPGKIGPVVKSKFGYHIIEVLEKNESGAIPFENAKEDIMNYLSRQQGQEALNNYIEEEKSGMDIDYPGGKPEAPSPMMPMQQPAQPAPSN